MSEIGESRQPFDAAAAWSRLSDLSHRMGDVSDPDIYDALKKEFDGLIEILKESEAPIPPAILANPTLRPHFVPSAPSANPSVPQEGDLVFGLPAKKSEEVFEPNVPQPTAVETREATPEELAEAETFIRNAKIAQMRGNRDEALNLLKQAEQLCPNASIVLEAIGDEMLASKKFADARSYYDRARKADVKNVSADRKFAELIFRTDAVAKTVVLAETEVVANARSAALLSWIVPGLGQIVSGRWVSGLIFFIGVFGLWSLAFLLGLTQALAQILNVSNARGEYNPLVFAAIPMAILLYLINVFDASSRAKAASSKRMIDRPLPPENLPFE